MDQDRQVRFAIPPFFLLASLWWGAHLSGRDLSPIFGMKTATEVLGLLTAAAVVIIPLGFLISAVSVLLLRLLAVIVGSPTYEARLEESTRKRICDQLRSTLANDMNKKLTLYVAATFDHELLAPGVHTWLLRRWNAFNIASHSVVALLLAHVVAPLVPIKQVFWWWVSTLVLVVILSVFAYGAWRDTMEMIDFQSYREQKTAATKFGAT